MFFPIRPLWVSATLGVCATACAQSPEMARIEPFSGTVGEALPFMIEGKNLAEPRGLWTSFDASVQGLPAAQNGGKKPEASKVPGTLLLPGQPTAHVGFLYLSTATGLSNPLLFLVDDLAVLRKKAPNKRSDALPVPVPHAVSGHTDTGESKFYRVELSAGKPVSLEVHAARIGSRLDPRIRLLDAEGKALAFADDSPGLGGDCRLRFTPEKSGPFLIELRDSAYNGGPEYRYHLRIGDFPLVSAVYPPVATAGSELTCTALEPSGISSAARLRVRVPANANASIPAPFRFSAEGPAALASVRATEFAVISEPLDQGDGEGPNARTAASLPGKCVVTGRLSTPGERDAYGLRLKKDDLVQIDPINREIGSSAAVYLAVYTKDGALVASNETPSNSPQDADLPLTLKAPVDGEYILHIEDICKRGTPSLVYAVQVLINPAPFEVSVPSNRFIAPRGGSFTAKVTLARRNMKEAVELSLESADLAPLPAGIRLENATIEKGKNETLLRVSVPPELPEGTLRHFQIRASATGGEHAPSTLAVTQTENKKNNGKKNDPFTVALAAMPQPPRLLTEALLFCVGPEVPDFFRIELTDRGALLPRSVGKSQFVLRQSAIEKEFATPVQLQFENLPEGVTVTHTGGRGGRIAGQVDFVCEIHGPAKPSPGPLAFDIVASADFKGAYKQVRLLKIPIKVVDPVEITAVCSPMPMRPGSTSSVRVQVTRHDAANPAPVELRAEGLPPGVSLASPIKPLSAGDSSIEVPLLVAPDAPQGVTESLRFLASSTVSGEPVSTQSPGVRLEIKQ